MKVREVFSCGSGSDKTGDTFEFGFCHGFCNKITSTTEAFVQISGLVEGLRQEVKGRLVNPGGVDPDPTLKKKTYPDLAVKKKPDPTN